jgi:hypothetical protein
VITSNIEVILIVTGALTATILVLFTDDSTRFRRGSVWGSKPEPLCCLP